MTGWLAFLGTILLCAAILGSAVWVTVRRVRRSIAAAREEPEAHPKPEPLQPPPVNDNDTLIAALDALTERRHPESEAARSAPSRRSRPPAPR